MVEQVPEEAIVSSPKADENIVPLTDAVGNEQQIDGDAN